MSKKMLKRSLALGALMAFVITGSAMAEEPVYSKYTGTGTESHVSNVYWDGNGGSLTLSKGTDATAIGKQHGNMGLKNFSEIVFDGQYYTSGFLANPGTIVLDNIGTIKQTDGSYVTILFSPQSGGSIVANVGDIYMNDCGNAIYCQSGSNLLINASGNVELGDQYFSSPVVSASNLSEQYSNVQNSAIINARNFKVTSPLGTALKIESYKWTTNGAPYEPLTGKNLLEINVSEDVVVDAKIAAIVRDAEVLGDALLDIDATNVKFNTKEYGIHALNKGKAEIDAATINVVATNEDGNAYGVYAETGSQIDLNGTTINITADSTNGEARAVNARGISGGYTTNVAGSVINLGNADTESINVTVKGDGYGLISQYQGSVINVIGDKLTINGTGDVTGIIAQNQTVTTVDAVNYDSNYNDNAKVVIGDGTVTKINIVDANGNAAGIGVSGMSMGKVQIAGDLYVNAKTAVEARGDSIIEINKAGSKDRTIQLDGDILFDYADNSRTTINAAVDVKLANADSYFNGKIIADPATKKAEIAGMSISLTNGAKWNLTGESVVNSATFGADSVLEIDGAIFEVSNNVYALNGTGSKDTLTIEKGAKLVVNNIDEKTYNIATGFETVSTDKWDIDNLNALMEGEWKETNGLQLVVSAKEVNEIASDTGISESTATLVESIIQNANTEAAKVEGSPEKAAVDFINNVVANNPTSEAVGEAINSATKMAEAGGNSATATNIVKNVTGVTNDRLSFNCGHSAPHKGGHGVGLFEEGSGADIWVEYVHGKDKVEDMPSTAGATSYEGQFNGFVMGVDFKKVNKFQSGIAFNYGEGDTNSVGSAARTHSDYDFWGVGYYGNIHNDDSNVIFDINYAKTDSDVTQNNSTTVFEASPETTTWTAGVKVEKLYQNENVQIVPYTGLRYMSIDSDDYSTKCGAFNYSMERQDIWLLPLGVSIRQEIANDNGWTVSPRVDLSYIWAFGDTNSNMEVKSPFSGVSQLGYDVMDDGSVLGLVGIEAHKGQWGFGVSYSYQKGDHSESKKWFIDANYSF